MVNQVGSRQGRLAASVSGKARSQGAGSDDLEKGGVVKELTKKIDGLEASIAELTDVVDSLARENNGVMEQNERLQKSLELYDQEIFESARFNSSLLVQRHNLEGRIGELEHHLNFKALTVERLEGELSDARNKLRDLAAIVSERDTAIDTLRQRYEKLERDASYLEGQGKSKESELAQKLAEKDAEVQALLRLLKKAGESELIGGAKKIVRLELERRGLAL